MKTDNILTAMSEFSSSSDIPVSLIRHSNRRAVNRSQADLRANAKVIPLNFAQQVACSV